LATIKSEPCSGMDLVGEFMRMKSRVVDDIPNRLVIAIEEHLAKNNARPGY